VIGVEMTVADRLAPALAVEGWMSPDELEVLYALAARAPGDGAVVEIGTYRGRATVALALGAGDGGGSPVYTFDPHLPFVGPRGGVFGPVDQASLYANLATAGVGERVFVVSLDSRAVARVWPGGPVGLLFIDGDHNAEAVWDDFWSWRPHLPVGATVAFDDVDHDGVATTVDSLLAVGCLVPEGRVGKVAWFRVAAGT
jgi:predicted O-methyltransferase YrrM